MQFRNIGPGSPEAMWLYVKNGHSAALAKDTWVGYAFADGARDGATVVPITVASNATMVAGVVVEAIPVGAKGYICVWGAYDGALCIGGLTTEALTPGVLLGVKSDGGTAAAYAAALHPPCGVFLEPLYTAGAGAVAAAFHGKVIVRCL
jgi:hypothetical protein